MITTAFNIKIGKQNTRYWWFSQENKLSVNEAKYFTTSGYSKFASKVFETRIKKGLVNMSSISNLAKNSDLNAKLKLL